MKLLQIVFFGFFFLFNSVFIIYNLVTGFDWSMVLIPFLIVLFCGFTLRSLLKK